MGGLLESRGHPSMHGIAQFSGQWAHLQAKAVSAKGQDLLSGGMKLVIVDTSISMPLCFFLAVHAHAHMHTRAHARMRKHIHIPIPSMSDLGIFILFRAAVLS